MPVFVYLNGKAIADKSFYDSRSIRLERPWLEVYAVVTSVVISYSKLCFALFLYRPAVKQQPVKLNNNGRSNIAL